MIVRRSTAGIPYRLLSTAVDMFRLRRGRLVCLLMIVEQIHRVSGSCTLCTNNDTPTKLETGTLPGAGFLTCEKANDLIQNLDVGDELCESMQLGAFMSCGCPTYPSTFCAMCDNDGHELPSNTKFNTIPLNTLPADSLCVDSLFTRQATGLCDEYRRAASYCGCPGSPNPICQAVCRPPSESVAGRLLPPYFEMTCSDMYLQSPFYVTKQECSDLQDLTYSLIDEMAYCCMDTVVQQSTVTCDLCSGGGLTNPGRWVTVVDEGDNTNTISMTCQDLYTLSLAVTNETYCNTSILQTSFVEACCLGWTDPPSAAPSESPSDAPSETPSFQPSSAPSTAPSAQKRARGQAQQKRARGQASSSLDSAAETLRSSIWGKRGVLVLSVILLRHIVVLL